MTIDNNGFVEIPIEVATSAAGSLINPGSGGQCTVNPGPSPINEIQTDNNQCADTVTVNKASPTITTQLKLVVGGGNLGGPILQGTAWYDTAPEWRIQCRWNSCLQYIHRQYLRNLGK
jgi:hypothetical protein